jgi:hypothetical protein
MSVVNNEHAVYVHTWKRRLAELLLTSGPLIVKILSKIE